jgi:hypothetical protein
MESAEQSRIFRKAQNMETLWRNNGESIFEQAFLKNCGIVSPARIKED